MFPIVAWVLLAGGKCGEAAAHLKMIDPVRVGYLQSVELTDEDAGGQASRTVEMQTLALNPPIFYVASLMDASEVDSIIEAANSSGAMHDSGSSHDRREEQSLKANSKAFRRTFKDFDKNKDKALDAQELQQLLQQHFGMPNHDHDMFLDHYNLSLPLVTMAHLRERKVDLGEYIRWFIEEQPHRRSRFSMNTFLEYEATATRLLQARVKEITKLPKHIIQRAEALQILHYPLKGHYSCHHDSSPAGLFEGFSVRIATITLFLNEAKGGGEIAFPGADHPHAQNYEVEDWLQLGETCQPTRSCTNMGGVVVKPKKGDAVWWYNMNVSLWAEDGRSNRPGPEAILASAIHCGAEVTEGMKWMANMWLHEPEVQNLDRYDRAAKEADDDAEEEL